MLIAIQTLLVHSYPSPAALTTWVKSSSFLSADRFDNFRRQIFTSCIVYLELVPITVGSRQWGSR
jgi:hypothetical protein